MISDLKGKGSIEAKADLVVIGAGTAGLPVSVMIARKSGQKVICLESGDYFQDAETHPLNEVVQLASEYTGASQGRFRCLGGTSTRWGGAMIPFQSADLDHADWPISFDEIEQYVPTVEKLFDLESGPYSDTEFPVDLRPNHVNRLAKWPEFKKRNVVNLVGKEAESSKNLDVWVNATVTRIVANPDGQGVELEARSLDGDSIRIFAQRMIVAAGAIETTRIALLIDQQNGGKVSSVSPSLGRYFTDHISIGISEIEPKRLTALNKIIGYRFNTSGGMRNIRFELAPDAPARQSLPPSFAHVGFEVLRPGGFEALREIFRLLQMRRMPPLSIGFDLIRNMPWLSRAVWWRFVHKRLLYPAHSRLVVHMVIEQVPRQDSYIKLSSTKFDPFGLPLAEICWQVSDQDIDNLNKLSDLFETTWNKSGLSSYGDWKRFPKESIGKSAQDAGGIFHPTGSTRMGHDPATGVVDRDLKLFSFPQIQLLSTSILPTGGGANPTMMLMLLAMRCVEQHVRGAGTTHDHR